MRTTISNMIRVEDPSPELKQYVKDQLELPNPDYVKKERMGFWTGRTPKVLRLYEWNGNALVLPFGLIRDLMPILSSGEIQSVFTGGTDVDYGAPVPLYDYQREAVAHMITAKYGILKSKAGSGKGLLRSAKIYTPDGYTRNGDLKIGDEVLNCYGGVSKVTGIYDRGIQPCYKFTFTDDTYVVCDQDHLWNVRNTRKATAGWETISAKRLYELGVCDSNGNRKWEIPVAKPVQFYERKVTIDPWLLGVLLGDGTFLGGEVSVSNTEKDILERVRKLANCPVYHRKSRVSMILTDKGSLRYRLEDYGLYGLHSWEKFIPKDYIYNSIYVRLKVLQGLIDTDGTVNRSEVTITSTSRRLVDGCLEIVQSLGGTGTIKERHTQYTYDGEKKNGRTSYRLTLKLYDFIPFTSEKHRSNYSERTKYVNAYRRIKSIEISAPKETRCISVDSDDSLYLTDGYVATHNTQMGIALIKALGKKALWLCHTADLLNQSKERAERYADSNLMGTITEGKVNIGTGITFATVQTMCNVDLERYRNEWDVIIVDECHRVSQSARTVSRYQKVLNNLAARHKYGLTATPDRSDGLIKATFALIGNVMYEVPDEAVADKVMRVTVRPVETQTKISESCLNVDGTINYTQLIEHMTTNAARSHLIASCIQDEKGHSCLILSDRIAQLEDIQDMLPEKMRAESALITGKMTSKSGKALREQSIEKMRTGELKYLFATYSLAKEGLDIPRLDRLFLASPVKFSSVVIQSIGRIARTFEGKETPVCYDFVDVEIGFCRRAFKERCRHYRKEQAIIEKGFLKDEGQG